MIILKRFIYLFIYYTILIVGVLFYKSYYAFIAPFLFSLLSVFFILSLLFRKDGIFLSLILVLWSLALGCELISVFHTGKFLDVLTLANLTEISSVGKNIIYSTLVMFCAFLFPIFFISGNVSIKFSKFGYFFPIVFLLFFHIFCDGKYPLIAFVGTFKQYVQQLYFKPQQKKMVEQMHIYGKDWVYKNLDVEDIPDLREKNIVTFFTEGLSLNMIDKFNQYPNLTPNISYFMDDALWFDNYYNHTAATYRSLRGQLSSSYQYAAGRSGGKGKIDFSVDSVELANLSKTSIVFLAEILRQNGYHSYFVCAHKSGDDLVKYLDTLGFDKVFAAGDFNQDNKDLTDGEVFYYLEKLMKSEKLVEPYFIGVYNLGTHMGHSTQYTVYQNPIGKNYMELNNLHEFDKRFGYFWDKIKENDILKDKTAIILTADHVFPPTSGNMDLFREFRTHFMGKIPFILWYNGIKHEMIDVAGKNSLDFAPTLLHWLRINEAKNYFLGCSLYDKDCAYIFQYVYNEGNDFYSTNPFRQLSDGDPKDMQIIQKIRDFYNLSEYRIFKWNL